ncbi:hypothetical protein [Nostoc sp. PCC 9305]
MRAFDSGFSINLAQSNQRSLLPIHLDLLVWKYTSEILLLIHF